MSHPPLSTKQGAIRKGSRWYRWWVRQMGQYCTGAIELGHYPHMVKTDNGQRVSIDHILPLSRCNEDWELASHPSNLRPLCLEWNGRKQDDEPVGNPTTLADLICPGFVWKYKGRKMPTTTIKHLSNGQRYFLRNGKEHGEDTGNRR